MIHRKFLNDNRTTVPLGDLSSYYVIGGRHKTMYKSAIIRLKKKKKPNDLKAGACRSVDGFHS